VRLDFPGGWSGDAKNAFTGAGLTPDETATQAYTRKLANFRKSSSAIKTGNMMQYAPDKGLYVYFRYDAGQTIMCVMNTGDKDRKVNLQDYAERTNGYSTAREVYGSGQTDVGAGVGEIRRIGHIVGVTASHADNNPRKA
jgi:glycosidase